ncbi:MAG: carbohydrate binding family 9 domain-containing protein, partial [Balneolales bacterium]|nr:carbohydrate binding family 9 domain-containing protein [Balneolales bacterium]
NEAHVIDNFIQQNPKQGAPSSYPTEVKILYNQHGLYIGAVCFQPESQVVVKNLERDFSFYQNDLFGVAIDGLLDKRNSLVFQVTPLGTLRDLQVIDGENENTDWNVTWNAKTTILEDRWIVEMVIPWNIIRYANNTDQLGIVFARNIRSLNEFSSAPAVPRSLNVYRMEYEALLTNLVSPPPSTNIQINPYALGDLQYVDDAGNTNSEFDPKIGGDIKWGISTNSVLDLTFNTDFAQAEADAQVVNLNRFSVFFPERRQFFLENSDLFSPSITNWIRPFFSRRIGLNASGRPIPIDAGARFVSQSSDHRLGSLIIRQREFDGTPASNFGVLRYSRNLSAQSRVGSMVTFRNDQSLGDTPSNNNFTYTVDGLYRPDPSFGVQGMITGSQDDITGNGLAGQLWAYYENNLVYIGLLEYYNRNYNPGMGLEILNDNYVMTAPAIFFDFRPDWLPSYIRSYNPGFYAYIFNSSVDGKHLFSYSGFRPVEFDFQNGANFYFTIEPNWQSLEEPFFPVGIEVATGNYQYVRYYLVAATNPASVISATFNSSFGEFYDGRLERYTLSGRVAPIPHIEFEGSYQLTRIHNLGINTQDDETYLIQFGPRLALNPRLLFSGLYQWNSASDQHLWNTRVSWEFMPLSFVYLVFNSSVTDTSDPLNRLNQQQYIAKVSYVHQF